MKRTFIETKYFTNKWQSLGFSDSDLVELQNELLDNPKIGSARICYLDIEAREELHLIDVFAKNEKDNLSKAERSAIKKLVKFIKEFG